MAEFSATWSENNHKYLVASINEIKKWLSEYLASQIKTNHNNNNNNQVTQEEIYEEKIKKEKQQKLKISNNGTIDFAMPARILEEWTEESPPALENIWYFFGLSKFERNVLVLCVGTELDSELANLCVYANGNGLSTYATFGLALSFLPHAHWSALTPAAPLRQFKLINFSHVPNIPLTSCPIHIEEKILHYLTGVFYFERQLEGVIKPVRENASLLADSHKNILNRILFEWKINTDRNTVATEKKLFSSLYCNDDDVIKDSFPLLLLLSLVILFICGDEMKLVN